MSPTWRFEHRERIDSTNDEAKRLAESGYGPGTVVTAVEQAAGRGRRGRGWHSPAGNLHCSILLERFEPATAPLVCFVAAIALREALAELALAADFRVKWPNDILCNGAKIAGMLLEQAGSLIILGVGVNVIAFPEEALYPATCLRRIGSGASAEDVLSAFTERLAGWYETWRRQGFAPIRQAWLAASVGMGQGITARLADGMELSGRFAGLGTDGALELELTDGTIRPILAADVFFARPHASGD